MGEQDPTRIVLFIEDDSDYIESLFYATSFSVSKEVQFVEKIQNVEDVALGQMTVAALSDLGIFDKVIGRILEAAQVAGSEIAIIFDGEIEIPTVEGKSKEDGKKLLARAIQSITGLKQAGKLAGNVNFYANSTRRGYFGEVFDHKGDRVRDLNKNTDNVLNVIEGVVGGGE